MSRTSVADPLADRSVSSISVRETVAVMPRSANAEEPGSTSFAFVCASMCDSSVEGVGSTSGRASQPRSSHLFATGATKIESGSDEPAPGLLHDLAVELEPAVGAEVLDDVPVHLDNVLAAALREAVAERQVNGSVDLLVEEGVLHVLRDPWVAADPQLAQPAGAVVAVQDLDQELGAVATRYPWVRLGEVWNEPNQQEFLTPNSPRLYVQRLLNPTYVVLHA